MVAAIVAATGGKNKWRNVRDKVCTNSNLENGVYFWPISQTREENVNSAEIGKCPALADECGGVT